MMLKSLVSAQWLLEHLEDENLIILYTTLVAKKEIISADFENLKIRNARFFDLKEKFSDQDSDLPNTFPSEFQFQEECRKLGINKNSKIVVYDTLGIYSSPRVWFLFKSMGHELVYVLNGGLQEWIKSGFPIVNKKDEQFELGNFEAKFQPQFLTDSQVIKRNLETKSAQVVDARSELRFLGKAPESRQGLRSGNIPNSCNLHYASLLEGGKYKSVEELKKSFTPFKNENSIIFSCGSGITACILFLAASEFLNAKLSVYDGSWTEWGSR